jgi:hypothetical protein
VLSKALRVYDRCRGKLFAWYDYITHSKEIRYTCNIQPIIYGSDIHNSDLDPTLGEIGTLFASRFDIKVNWNVTRYIRDSNIDEPILDDLNSITLLNRVMEINNEDPIILFIPVFRLDSTLNLIRHPYVIVCTTDIDVNSIAASFTKMCTKYKSKPNAEPMHVFEKLFLSHTVHSKRMIYQEP